MKISPTAQTHLVCEIDRQRERFSHFRQILEKDGIYLREDEIVLWTLRRLAEKTALVYQRPRKQKETGDIRSLSPPSAF